MTGRVQHLVQHSGTYLFRRRLPEPLARLLGRTHIKRSLGTRDRRQAIRLAREASARVERLRAEVEQAMSEGRLPTREELTAVLAAFFRDLLEVGERRRDRTRGIPYWEEFRHYTADLGEDADPEVIAARLATLPPLEPEDDPDGRVVMAELDARQNRREAVEQRLDRMLARAGLALPHEHPAYARLCRLALAVRVEAAKIDAARDHGDYSDGWPQAPTSVPPEAVPDPSGGVRPPPPPVAVALIPATASHSHIATSHVPHSDIGTTPSTAPLLSAAWAEFAAAKVSSGGWTDRKTREDAERALRYWCELMGDRPTDRITRRDALDFRDLLRRIPALNGKSIYENRTLKEAIALADDIRRQLDARQTTIEAAGQTFSAQEAAKREERLTLKTANRLLTYFTSFGNWARKHERSEWFANLTNPFQDLLYEKRHVRRERDRDQSPHAIPDEVLRLLFSSPIWSGRHAGTDTVEGDDILRDHKYWVPLIGLFSGMRLGEICQLRLDDIRERQGVLCFAVENTGETSTKTESGERLVPIHEELLRLGVLDRWAEMARRGERRLFPEITPRASADDDYAATFSRWFSRYRHALAQRPGEAGRRYAPLAKPAYVFHALRHSFITRARETPEMTDAQLDRLIGHKGQATRDIYTGALSLPRLAEALNAVRFDLDLSRLYLPGARRTLR
jgi:integrase